MREASDLSAKPIMHAAPGPTFALARTYLRTGASRNAEKWRIRGRSAVTDGRTVVGRPDSRRARAGGWERCMVTAATKLIPAPRAETSQSGREERERVNAKMSGEK